jgi:hypothetical protein
MEALSTPDFTMATPNGVAAARQAASGYTLRALPRSEWHKTYTTSWDINRRRAHARNTFRLSVNHSVNERGGGQFLDRRGCFGDRRLAEHLVESNHPAPR